MLYIKKNFLFKKLDGFSYSHKGTCSSAGAVKKEEKINIPSSKIYYESIFQFRIRNQLIYVIQMHEYIQTKIIVHV